MINSSSGEPARIPNVKARRTEAPRESGGLAPSLSVVVIYRLRSSDGKETPVTPRSHLCLFQPHVLLGGSAGTESRVKRLSLGAALCSKLCIPIWE